MSFSIRTRIPTSHKRSSIFGKDTSIPEAFLKKSVLENSGECAGDMGSFFFLACC